MNSDNVETNHRNISRTNIFDDRVKLSISGEVYETKVATLERFPDTLLGNYDKRSPFYNAPSGCYFFSHNKMFFDAILFFYQSNGILRCPPELPISLFEAECRFFELPDSSIKRLRVNTLEVLNDEEECEDRLIPTFRGKIWDLINNPETSAPAKYFAVFSHSLIILSVGTICFETLPYLKKPSQVDLRAPFSTWEFLLNLWFLLHFLCRAAFTPHRTRFIKALLTWIDVFAILPYFFTLSLRSTNFFSVYVFRFQHVCQIFRILRLLRLSKHSKRIRVIGLAIRSSADVYATLFLCIIIIITLGGSFVYFFEIDNERTHFCDIPSGIYWSVVSMTTVGYGDYYPQTVQGKLFGAGFMVFGAMMLSIPMLTIIAHHVALQKQNVQDEKYL